jgi:hypothetical protein
MRRLAVAILASFALSSACAQAAPPGATIRAMDPEKGKIVVFGCQPTEFVKRTGTGASARFEPARLGTAVRSQVFETIASPVTDSSTGTAYREVVVPIVLGLREGWLPERCFHLVVPQATVTCASPVFQDSGSNGNEQLTESGYTVRPGEIVYPTGSVSSQGDYVHLNVHRPSVDGFVPRRCLKQGSPERARIPH